MIGYRVRTRVQDVIRQFLKTSVRFVSMWLFHKYATAQHISQETCFCPEETCLGTVVSFGKQKQKEFAANPSSRKWGYQYVYKCHLYDSIFVTVLVLGRAIRLYCYWIAAAYCLLPISFAACSRSCRGQYSQR